MVSIKCEVQIYESITVLTFESTQGLFYVFLCLLGNGTSLHYRIQSMFQMSNCSVTTASNHSCLKCADTRSETSN